MCLPLPHVMEIDQRGRGTPATFSENRIQQETGLK